MEESNIKSGNPKGVWASPSPYEGITVAALRSIARGRGIKYFSNMKRPKLIEVLIKNDEDPNFVVDEEAKARAKKPERGSDEMKRQTDYNRRYREKHADRVREKARLKYLHAKSLKEWSERVGKVEQSLDVGEARRSPDHEVAI